MTNTTISLISISLVIGTLGLMAACSPYGKTLYVSAAVNNDTHTTASYVSENEYDCKATVERSREAIRNSDTNASMSDCVSVIAKQVK